jgi:hypothetical protein
VKNVQILKIFKKIKKEKERKNKRKRETRIKQEKMKKEKSTQKKKSTNRRVNGLAQHRAHAGGAEFRPANGRSIGIAPVPQTGGKQDFHAYLTQIALNRNQ